MISAGWLCSDAAMMKEELGQGGEERGGSPMARGVRDPEQGSPIGHAQPAIDIAADLNYGPITCGDIPSRQHRGLLRNEGLLGQSGRREVSLQVPAPRLELVVLLLQLGAQRAQAQLGFDARAQDRLINRFGDKIVCAGFQAANFALLARRARSA